ncbi:phage portal protein [Muricoccus vinaceus]|uniref:Phage portal protein n=1 Tax=Muricoccus vinaceus TaxID=424704 RepID=A0ABV6INV6_9PROT
MGLLTSLGDNVRRGVSAALPWVGLGGNSTAGLEAGAGARRLRNFRPGPAHVNTLVANAGRTVTERARWLVRNNAYAINAVDWWGSAVVGSGITPSWGVEDQRLKAALRATWDEWTDEADAEGLTDFYGLMRRGVREMFITGEVFYRLRYRRPGDGLTVPLQLQMLPSEMLDTAYNLRLENGNTVRQGIEFDLIGRRVAYWFWRVHPADSTEQTGFAGQRSRVPAAEVIHLLDPVEAGQIRGLSRFANVVVQLFTLDQYDDAELERKKVAALFAGFITRPAEVDPEENIVGVPLPGAGLLAGGGPPIEAAIAGLEAGTMQVLMPGEGVEFAEPADVGGNYEAFQFRALLRIGVGLGVPYHGLTGDMTRGNYGNTRASSLDARRRTEAFQWSVVIFGFCRRVAAAWTAQAALAGAVPGMTAEAFARTPKAFNKIRWMPPPWGWVDPLKDVQADALMVENGFKARSEVMEANGFDAEETDRRRAADQEREERLGLTRPAPAAPGATTQTEEDDQAPAKPADPGST